jgi:hypothetical protein
MAFTAPTTFANGSRLVASDIQGNFDALRVYLHEGIASGDLAGGDWVQARHIAGPPVIDYSGVQHGVSGHQGGGSAPAFARFSFTSSALSGDGSTTGSVGAWTTVPLPTLKLDIRRPADLVFHWWGEWLGGPDDRTSRIPSAQRTTWLAPYIGNASQPVRYASQVIRNNGGGWETSSNTSQPDVAWEVAGGWSSLAGSKVVLKRTDNYIGQITFGLCAFSRLQRSACLNWNIAVEAYY